MRPAIQTKIARNGQQGYAILMVMVFLALLVLATIVVSPNIVTDVQRQKEEDMIWRGKQYARGIRLYYTKVHRFPTQLEDLYKPKTGIRFMRQAYKDPMNAADGSWRLIYVGPSGQLIGSTKNRSLIGAQGTSGLGTPVGGTGTSPFGASPGVGSSMAGASQQNAAPSGQNPSNGQNTDASGPMGSLQPVDLSDTASIVGGNIIGVGSKINKKSIIWYDKAKNYRQFEFIWDPSVDSLTGQRIGSIPAGNPNPFGAQPNSNSTAPPLSPGPGSNSTFGGSSSPAPTGNPPTQTPPNQ
jgi:type II secretory pathway pseudopilin PulG